MALLQETKRTSIDEEFVRSCWSGEKMEFMAVDSDGVGGGLLCIWNPDFADDTIIFFEAEMNEDGIVDRLKWKVENSGVLTVAFAYKWSASSVEAGSNLTREDFERTGLSSVVTVGVRDIQGDDFCGKADSVFLDLPQPWLAIPSAGKILKQDAILCSFSLCIEQAQHSCETLQSNFPDIRTFEVLLRMYEVREGKQRTSKLMIVFLLGLFLAREGMAQMKAAMQVLLQSWLDPQLRPKTQGRVSGGGVVRAWL
ncbi:hypothetical protein HYC85_003166 [Camellia sinensis]|uniref:tRNA (adenine(58)-N(1))-methyltransferase n=1 Tax=Camellia sinensis TaxID=4442 RepID=A0A7J7IBJ4_CAMSI|nr:hypothetical protein HYC85_003166 [Camellia sinensis]